MQRLKKLQLCRYAAVGVG